MGSTSLAPTGRPSSEAEAANSLPEAETDSDATPCSISVHTSTPTSTWPKACALAQASPWSTNRTCSKTDTCTAPWARWLFVAC